MPENKLPKYVQAAKTAMEETLAQVPEIRTRPEGKKGYILHVTMCPITFGRQQDRLLTRLNNEGIKGVRVHKPDYYDHQVIVPAQQKDWNQRAVDHQQ